MEELYIIYHSWMLATQAIEDLLADALRDFLDARISSKMEIKQERAEQCFLAPFDEIIALLETQQKKIAKQCAVSWERYSKGEK